MNIMLETSGRDVAMFHYIDKFFSSKYIKLAIRYEINDIRYAKESVDNRMLQEMKIGAEALTHPKPSTYLSSVEAIIGGPYGSAVLDKVQEVGNRHPDPFP